MHAEPEAVLLCDLSSFRTRPASAADVLCASCSITRNQWVVHAAARQVYITIGGFQHTRWWCAVVHISASMQSCHPGFCSTLSRFAGIGDRTLEHLGVDFNL
jgi:hypothetical protein